MPANNTIVAFYGNSTSCRRYRLDAVDWAAAQNAPDKALWSLSAQGPVTDDPSYATLPPVVRYDLVTSWPNRHGWSPEIPGAP
jgi:hypothetical protein